MKNWKAPVRFTLLCLPVAIVAIIATCLYQFELYPPEIMEEAVAQLGSIELVMLLSVVQNTGIILFCSFFGYILAQRMGLWKPIKFEKKALTRTLLISIGMGILLSLDYWTFGNAIEGIQESTAAGMTAWGILASILYGGIVEEILLRLFMMSLIAFLLHRLFWRNTDQDSLPPKVFVIANIIAAILFTAGHLPATLIAFGELTPLILLRCFLFNGGFGIVLGWLYRKYGIAYAILCHMTIHIGSKLIWAIFI